VVAGGTAVLVAALLLATPALAAGPPADVAPAIGRAVHYLRFSQNDDGGFGAARKQSSTQLHTGWTALGLASANRNPRDVVHEGHSIIDYVSAHAGNLNDIGELERTLLILRASGMPPKLGNHNLRAGLIRKQRGDGSFGTINHTAFGILALRASGRTTRSREVRAATRWLLRQQNSDGGYGFSKSAASDVDDTGALLQALAAGGRKASPVVDRAVRYLRKAQRPDGGFGQMAASESNAQSTAFAIQGLVAAGRNPRKVKRTRNPIEYLKSLQAPDGSVRYSRTSTQTPVWVTAQALNGLEAKPYPLRPAPRKKARTVKAAESGGSSSGASGAAGRSGADADEGDARGGSGADADGGSGAEAEKADDGGAEPTTANPPGDAATATQPSDSSLDTSPAEVQTKPVAATTTTTAPAGQEGDGEGGVWPFVFAGLLGIVILAGIRLAWRRG
jgi:energy-coupling factor transport system substrate-specific component